MRDVGKRLLTVLRLIQLLLRQKIDRLSRCLHATVFDGYASACRGTRLSIMHRSSVSLSVCPVGQYTQNKCTHIVIVTHRGAAPTRPAYVSALRPECRYTCYAPRSRGGCIERYRNASVCLSVHPSVCPRLQARWLPAA